MCVSAVPDTSGLGPKSAVSAASFTGAKSVQGGDSSRGSTTQYCCHGCSSTSSGVGK